MTPPRSYARALYGLAQEEGLTRQLLRELELLSKLFRENPGYGRLLSAPGIPKAERLRLPDRAFRGKIHPYLLNFLLVLTERGEIRLLPRCCAAFRELYNRDSGILEVRAVSALPLTGAQQKLLAARLEAVTGQKIRLQWSRDPRVLGGICLSWPGHVADGTARGRLDSLGRLLKNTVL